MNFSIVVPIEEGRIPIFKETLKAYNSFGLDDGIEFVLVSRSIKDIDELEKLAIDAEFKLINYKWKGDIWEGKEIFNPSAALNLGVKNASHQNIIITCPEVKPVTNILEQFSLLGRGTYVALVYDIDKEGKRCMELTNSHFRTQHPGYYFLACFKKEDIEAINGWDNKYMKGHSFDDDSFGERFKRMGFCHKALDDIQAEHQFHQRSFNHVTKFWHYNKALIDKERQEQTTRVPNGLDQVEEYLCDHQ